MVTPNGATIMSLGTIDDKIGFHDVSNQPKFIAKTT
jgi:hypothetical protein